MKEIYSIIDLDIKHRKRGEMILFELEASHEVVKKCRKYSLKIIGFDSFRVFEHSIQPVMEHSPDYSRYSKEASWDYAEAGLNRIQERGLLQEFVIEFQTL